MTVHLTGVGTYVPDDRLTGADIAERSGVPEEVVVEKMGVVEKRVCRGEGDHPSDMCVAAAREALADAGVDAGSLDAVRYHGSEFKDFVVWNLAADVANRIDATDAYASESYALCAGAPVALREVAAQLEADALDRVLLIAASREEDLVDYDDPDTSFTFNFGSGASAFVVESDAAVGTGSESHTGESNHDGRTLATVEASAAVTDGSFSRDVVMPGGGTRDPPSRETVDSGMHALRVPDHESMKERLGEVSLSNFLEVTDTALDRSGLDRDDLDFAAITHMKRSFHEYLCDELGLGEREQYYLDEFGHVQAVDQALATNEARQRGWITPGDTVLYLAAGTGYTWAATVLEWRS